MVTTSKSGYRPHSIEYRRIQQVDVPDTYTLRELVAGMEGDIGVSVFNPSQRRKRTLQCSTKSARPSLVR